MIAIPTQTPYVLREGNAGIVTFAVQRAANRMSVTVAEDMLWGKATTTAVLAMQKRLGVVADGIFGPASQRSLADFFCAQQTSAHDLPASLLASVVSYESGAYLGAVNWQVAGGVDCGITQRRVYDDDYDDDAVIKRAFDASYQVGLLASSLAELTTIFRARPGVSGDHELAYRLAVLNHNYPSLADAISRTGIRGLSAYYTTAQAWVTGFGIKFPDGLPVRTPLEWGQRYALGAPAHREPGQAVRLVKDWS